MLYTGIRVGELVKIKIVDVDLHKRQIQVKVSEGQDQNQNQNIKNKISKKGRVVLFPASFKKVLSDYIKSIKHLKQDKTHDKTGYLFESDLHKAYSDQGIRRILRKYTKTANMAHAITPHKLRHFLFTWMKQQNIDDALIRPPLSE